MRIIFGKYNRRLIKAPKGMATRPTSDRVKEGLFNILGNKVENSNCLDMFAGSGNLGIECLSRNAKKVVFIDKSFEAIKTIKDNLQTLKVEKENYLIFHDDYHIVKKLNMTFDIIFVDPPYRMEIITELLEMVKKYNLLTEYGLIIYETDKDKTLNDEYGDYSLKKYKYGDTYLNILYKK